MAARYRKRCVIYVASDGVMQFQKEYCVATIVNERLRGVDDGFLTRRFVCRQESLGSGAETARDTEQAADDTPLRDRHVAEPLQDDDMDARSAAGSLGSIVLEDLA